MDGILAEYSRTWQREQQESASRGDVRDGGPRSAETPADDGYDDEVIDDVIADEDTLNNDNTASTNSLLRASNASLQSTQPIKAPVARLIPASSAASGGYTAPAMDRPVTTIASVAVAADVLGLSNSDSSDTDSLVSQPLTGVSSLTNTPRSAASINPGPVRSTAFQPVKAAPVKRHVFDVDDVSRLIADEMETVNTSSFVCADINKGKDFDEARSDSGVSDSTLDDAEEAQLLSKEVLRDIFTFNADEKLPAKPVQVTAYPVVNGRTNGAARTPTQSRASARRPPPPSIPPDDSVLEAQQLAARFAPTQPSDPIEKIIEVCKIQFTRVNSQ